VRIEPTVQRLDAKLSEVAHQLLHTPSGRDAFEFGRAVGIYAGLRMAKELLLNFYEEERKASFED
jgi:hypothetical protein